MKTLTLPATIALVALIFATHLAAEDNETGSNIRSKYEAVSKRLTDQDYELRYKFKPGETLRWKVVHLGTTETTIQGNTISSQSRSISTKVWKVSAVDAAGNIKFVHSVSDADMWSKVSGRPEVSYNSKSDAPPHPDYEAVADTIGVPLATVTIDPTGKVVKRENERTKGGLGHGQIAVPLPAGKVRIGHVWHVPDEVIVRLADRRIERIQTRQKYRLEKVQTGVATISVETQVLSPVNDAKIKSQLVQQLNAGTIKFDIDTGRMISKRLDWDETVIGFNGAESILKYLARFTEEAITGEVETASRKTPAGPRR